MPGRLHVDWVPDGTYAFKPHDAAAYCEGARVEQVGNNPLGEPPPGLTSPALDLWLQGYADSKAGAGGINGACGIQNLGPELVPDPYFGDWDGAANPNNFPVGWALSGQNATNFFEPITAAGLHMDQAGGATPGLTVDVGVVDGTLYRVAWKYNTLGLTGTQPQLSVGTTGVQLLPGAGLLTECCVAGGPTSTLFISQGTATATQAYFDYLSVREML